MAASFRKGRVFLAGDAAHVNNPLGGLGLNFGIHDAVELSDLLGRVIRREAPEDILNEYDLHRRPLNIEFVQQQTVANKKRMEEKDPAARAKDFEQFRRTAADPGRAPRLCAQGLADRKRARSEPPCRRVILRRAQYPIEARAYLLLRFGDMRIERGEIRQVGRAVKQSQQPRPRGLRIERPGQAKPQDLRQVVVEPRRRPQHVGIFRRQQAQPPRLVEHARGVGVEDLRLLRRVNELEILRDELQIDQPAGGIFEVPARVLALLLGDRLPHLDHIRRHRRRIALAAEHGADHLLDAGGERRRRLRPRARASAPCAPRSRLRCPGSSAKASRLVATGPERPDGRSRMST